jgi:hypothetical protein
VESNSIIFEAVLTRPCSIHFEDSLHVNNCIQNVNFMLEMTIYRYQATMMLDRLNSGMLSTYRLCFR